MRGSATENVEKNEKSKIQNFPYEPTAMRVLFWHRYHLLSVQEIRFYGKSCLLVVLVSFFCAMLWEMEVHLYIVFLLNVSSVRVPHQLWSPW